MGSDGGHLVCWKEGGWGAGEFGPSLKMSSFAALGSWTLISLDAFSTLVHPSGRPCVSVCPSGPVPEDVPSVSSWRRAQGTEHGEGLICATCNQSGHDCREWRGGGGPADGSRACSLAFFPRTGWVPWEARLPSWCNRISQNLLSAGVSPPVFLLFCHLRCYLVLKKTRWGGTRGCKMP